MNGQVMLQLNKNTIFNQTQSNSKRTTQLTTEFTCKLFEDKKGLPIQHLVLRQAENQWEFPYIALT